MALTVQFVKDHLTEFDSTADETIQRWIDFSSRQIDVKAWGNRADDGHLFLTGHYLKFDKSGGALGGGALQSKKVGPLSASFKVSSWMSQGSLSKTTYGQEYLNLLRLVFPSRVF